MRTTRLTGLMVLVLAVMAMSALAAASNSAPSKHPKANALYGSGTCQLASGGTTLGYVGCSGSQFFTNARGRIRNFAAPYNHGKDFHCTAQLANQAKTYPVAADGRFHFTAVIAQGSHGPRGRLKVLGRFTSPTAAHGSYRYDLGRGCHDRQRNFRVRFIGTPGT